MKNVTNLLHINQGIFTNPVNQSRGFSTNLKLTSELMIWHFSLFPSYG